MGHHILQGNKLDPRHLHSYLFTELCHYPKQDLNIYNCMWISCTWEDSLMKMVKRIHKAPCLPLMLPPSNPAFPEQNMCLKFGTYHGFQVRCQPYSQKGYCASAKSDSWDGEMSCCPHIDLFEYWTHLVAEFRGGWGSAIASETHK